MNKRPQKLNVLLVNGYSNHFWQHTTELTQQILNKSGLFNLTITTAPRITEPEWSTWSPHFYNYDVVIQTCNDKDEVEHWPTEVEHDLEHFVENGGGLYILHSANNAFPHWAEYNRMIGLGWRDKEFGPALIINSDGSEQRIPAGEGKDTYHGDRSDVVLTRLGHHPIHTGLPQQWKVADLEVYCYARGPAEALTVLSYAEDPESKLNFPIEWTVQYGKGSVYNSTFGHVWQGDQNPDSMRCIAFQTLLIRAIEWLGDQTVTWPLPDEFPTKDEVRLAP